MPCGEAAHQHPGLLARLVDGGTAGLSQPDQYRCAGGLLARPLPCHQVADEPPDAEAGGEHEPREEEGDTVARVEAADRRAEMRKSNPILPAERDSSRETEKRSTGEGKPQHDGLAVCCNAEERQQHRRVRHPAERRGEVGRPDERDDGSAPGQPECDAGRDARKRDSTAEEGDRGGTLDFGHRPEQQPACEQDDGDRRLEHPAERDESVKHDSTVRRGDRAGAAPAPDWPRHGAEFILEMYELSEAEATELLRVALPVLRDLDPDRQEDVPPEELLDRRARLRTDVTDAAAALADDDRLLAVALDEQVRVHVDEVFVVAFDDVVDGHGERMRQLVVDAFENGLADVFGDAVLDAFVGDRVVRVQRRQTPEAAG